MRKHINVKKIGANRSSSVLELIRTNICGHQYYFITFINNYSRYGYLYLIHEKSQPLDIFKSYKVEVENQLGKKIKVVKSNNYSRYGYYGRYDGSGEQRLGPFARYLQECNIVPQYTMPRTPNQNGVS